MRGPTGKPPKDRPLDYYLPPPRLDPPQRSSWQPPGLSPDKFPINPVSGKFLSAADMYRQDSTPYAYPAQQQSHPYADPRLQAPPRMAQPARPLVPPRTPQPPEPPTIDRTPSYGYLGTHSTADIRHPPHSPLPFPTSPPPQQGLLVPTSPRRPRTAERTDDTANERPSIEERPSLGSPPPRLRTLSQPNRDFRHPPQSPPPLLPVPDPFSVLSPRRGGNYPNPNDPFSVLGPRSYPLKQTRSDTTDGSHRGCTHACMSLNRTDRIRMIRFPMNVVMAVQTAIEASWPRGIQNEREIFHGAYEFQLKGNPWTGQGDESVPARILMCDVLSAIYHHGWELRMSTDISQKAQDKDLLVFREAVLPPPCKFLAISFNDSDRLRIISGSNGSSTANVAPYDVINATKNVWGGNVQKEQWKVQGVAWEFKLAGSPWWASGEESIHVRMLLLNMLDQLTVLGWEFHASLDMTAGPGGATRNAGSDTDCWILKKLR